MMILSLILALVPPLQDDPAADKAATEALEAFKKAFKGTEQEKSAAIEDLGKVQHAKTISRLAALLTAAESTNVRVNAAKTLGKFSDHKKPAATALANTLSATTKDQNIFGPICDALGELQEASVIPILVRYFEEKDETVARRTLQAAGRIGSPAAIDPIIGLLGRQEKIVKSNSGSGGVAVSGATNNNATGAAGVVAGPDTRARDRAASLIAGANQALKDITKESNTTADAWSGWWAKNKATFKK